MSIRFWATKAPKVMDADYECFCVRKGKACPDCAVCSGSGRDQFFSPEGMIQLSNVNAMAFIRVLDQTAGEYGGEWSLERLPDLIRHALKVKNLDGRREVLEEAPMQDRRVFWEGRSPDYVQATLDRFIALFQQAQSLESPVQWG